MFYRLVGDGGQVSATALDDAQILLSQTTDVYYTPSGISVGGESSQAVDALVALPQ